jgi:multidrug resistance efflux pump
MGARIPTNLNAKRAELSAARDAAQAELSRLDQEEEYLLSQVRQAEEQVRYYEGLLSKLRRDWGRPERLPEIVRRLG